MQKARHEKTHRRRAPGSWLSTARSAMQSARLAGRLFRSRNDRFTKPDQKIANKKVAADHIPNEKVPDHKIVENFQTALNQIFRAEDPHQAPARTDLSAAATDARFTPNTARAFGHSDHDHVVLFAPRPITRSELYKENLKRAAAIRQRHRRRGRFEWLYDNAGTIAGVTIILVLAWFLSAR
jgi:hypothetical protein